MFGVREEGGGSWFAEMSYKGETLGPATIIMMSWIEISSCSAILIFSLKKLLNNEIKLNNRTSGGEFGVYGNTLLVTYHPSRYISPLAHQGRKEMARTKSKRYLEVKYFCTDFCEVNTIRQVVYTYPTTQTHFMNHQPIPTLAPS